MIARIACHKATRRARRQRGDSARQVDALGVERAAGANRQRRRQPISSDSTLPNGNSRPIYPRAGYTGLLPVYFFSAAALSFSYSALAASANFWAFSATTALVFASFSIAASFAAWI